MTIVNYDWDEDEDNIVEEYDDVGTIVAEYTTEAGLFGNLVSQRRIGQDSYYHFDGQGSTLALSNANGDVTDTYAYAAFGEVTTRTGSTISPFQYVGQKGYYRDAETDGYEIRRRPLLAETGRWLCADSLELAADINTYRYAYNTPSMYFDPTGNEAICFEEKGIDRTWIVDDDRSMAFTVTGSNLRFIGGDAKELCGLLEFEVQISSYYRGSCAAKATDTINKTVGRSHFPLASWIGILLDKRKKCTHSFWHYEPARKFRSGTTEVSCPSLSTTVTCEIPCVLKPVRIGCGTGSSGCIALRVYNDSAFSEDIFLVAAVWSAEVASVGRREGADRETILKHNQDLLEKLRCCLVPECSLDLIMGENNNPECVEATF
jgi:RHS repeat-associated protein